MKRPLVHLAAALAAVSIAGSIAAQGGTTPIPSQADLDRPVSGTAPTIASARGDVVAWLQQVPGAERVMARIDDDVEPTALGPIGIGIDGAPTSAALGDGSVWVLASRDDGTRRRLWARQWASGGWQPPVAGPIGRSHDHHPAVTAAPGSQTMWAAWVGEDDDHRDAMLYASAWDGAGWSSAEPLPRTASAPMAPSITIGPDGAPVVAFAAGHGAEAEIWVTTRRGGRWTAPRPLTDNVVPDITPSITTWSGGLLVSWVTYTDAGYLPMARTGADVDTWAATAAVSPSPGSRPVSTAIDGEPAVFWRHLEDAARGGTIQAARLRDGRWSSPTRVAAVSGSPFAVSAGTDGRLRLAFARPQGDLGVATGEPGSADPLEGLVRAAGARFGATAPASAAPTPAPADEDIGPPPLLPENYTAFGDSITNGVVYDPERRTSAGYRDPLQKSLRNFFGTGTIFNAGVDGEPTEDGVGRIDNAIDAQDPGVIMILEGTNDIVANIDVGVIAFNLRRMLQRAEEEKPGLMRLIGTLPPRLDPGPDGFDGPGNGRIDELNGIIMLFAPEEGAYAVDLNTPLDGHPELMSNHLHPSVAGYEVMANQWFATIQPLLLALTNFGDVDDSGRTDGLDLLRLAFAFGSMFGEERYDAAADINGDGIIDGFDLDLLIEFFGLEVPPEGGS